MNLAPGLAPAIVVTLSLAGSAAASEPLQRLTDPAGDALVRRTDPGADGPLNPDQVLPDLISCTISKWQSPTPATDPFAGTPHNSSIARLFRIDLEFQGLVNPPGPLEISGDHDPFRHGPSPLYGYLELNIDRDRATGGDPTPEATNRFLANVGRFGTLPGDSINARAVTRPGQVLGHHWQDPPQFELSGAEFALKLCGCEPATIVSTSIPGDTVFSSGDTWIISGRFFERSRGFDAISRMNLGGGACARPGEYSPVVRLRFSHDAASDVTTVSMVYALDQVGAGLMAGLPSAPPTNLTVECDGNQGSVYEALKDIADAATLAAQGAGWPDLFTRTISREWAYRSGDLGDFMDPTDWRVTALFGTTYSTTIANPPSESALFVWTDAGFELARGDVDGNGVKNRFDRGIVSSRIETADGTPDDADGIVNGVVVVINHGPEFDISDLDGNGIIDALDQSIASTLITCGADWNGDLVVTLQDVFEFLDDWFAGDGDANFDLATTLQDVFTFLTMYFEGCR